MVLTSRPAKEQESVTHVPVQCGVSPMSRVAHNGLAKQIKRPPDRFPDRNVSSRVAS
jgi:hypothetical protein